MKNFEVIIIGGGPAGLKCAETLKNSGLRVALLEKDSIFGDKLCAGGLTANDLRLLNIPDRVIEHKICDTAMYSPKRKSTTHARSAFLYTVDRKELGKWQRSLLLDSDIVVMENTKVTAIRPDAVILKDGTHLGYKYLVGADGHASKVRKFIGLPAGRKLIGIQYTLPAEKVNPKLEIHLDARLFRAWYAWIFPHRNSIAIGCCGDPQTLPPSKLKANFHQWLNRKNIDPGTARLRTYPICYDYRGIRFGNVFLAGEAAGMASGLTGEGIYQSLVSGQEVARMIMEPGYISGELKKVLRYNSIQNRIMKLFNSSFFFRKNIHELLLMAMNNQTVKKFIRSSFSPAKEG